MKKLERLTVVKAFTKQYRKATKKLKGKLLTQVSQATGYSRKHLMEILPHPPERKTIRRRRNSPYATILVLLKKLWAISNYACGKRLVPLIPLYLGALERHEHWVVGAKEKERLLTLSPATTDRLLKHERRQISLKGRCRTKPGTLLKQQVPIRTFADWEETQPGFLEIDSVHHCGGNPAGDYLYSLDSTAVATGWNECCAHRGKGELRTVAAVETIKSRLPFPLLGLDFDTGGEFVNWHFIRYAQRNRITYTRAREEKKNDQCFVEQQNYSVVRRFVGYQRLDTERQLKTLNRLYLRLSDYQNFFQSMMKLKEKVRHGTRLTRRYPPAETAYQRVLKHPEVSSEVKEELRERFLALNPKKLLLEITRLGQKLVRK